MAMERRLGRGLESLLGGGLETPAPVTIPAAQVSATEPRKVPIGQILPNPVQPRNAFSERELADLCESIKSVGILQPLVVRKGAQGYELIAGERRLRAAKLAGLAEVPVVERHTSDDEMLTLALIENLQREDLNPIEKAKGFKDLIERYDLTQESASKRLGKDRSTIANFIRLLDLPESVQHIVSRGTISMGHARALLSLQHSASQQALALRIEEEGLSVREVERMVALLKNEGANKKPKPKKVAADNSPHLRDIEDRAREKFGTKVNIEYKGGQGRMTVHFQNDDDFQRVLDVLGLSE